MNLTRPLILGLGALLVSKMLSRGIATDPSSVPQRSGDGAPSPDGGLLGGLGGLLEKLQTAGYGETAKSWVGPGQNQPIEPAQLRSALGQKTLSDVARHAGISEQELLSQLSQNLPEFVDKLTPHGQVPGPQEIAAAYGQKTETAASMLVPETVLYTLRVVSGHRGRSLQGGRHGLGADPGLRQGTGGQRGAGVKRMSCRRKPHPAGQAEWPPQALRRRGSHGRRDWSSPGPQSPHRGRNGGEAGYYPGLVPQACRPQVRWLESPSRPRQTAHYARARAADRSHGERELGLGL